TFRPSSPPVRPSPPPARSPRSVRKSRGRTAASGAPLPHAKFTALRGRLTAHKKSGIRQQTRRPTCRPRLLSPMPAMKIAMSVLACALALLAGCGFADLGGSPPPARYVAVVNRFVVLSGMGTATPYRIQWSGLNAVTTWTPGVNSSDFQDLPHPGRVRPDRRPQHRA